MEYDSSQKICSLECGSKCCRSTPPGLTEEDFNRIQEKMDTTHWFQMSRENSKVRVIGKKKNFTDCYFLAENGLCEIYNYRPLDCRLFPLFVKMKREKENEYRIRWYIWYCPLTEKIGVEELLKEAKHIVCDYLRVKPDVVAAYQTAMLETGGYKKKHFLKEELLTIKSND